MPDESSLPVEDRSLELDGPTMRRWVELAMNRLVEHIASLSDQPAGYAPAALAGAEPPAEPAPERGCDLETLLDYLFNEAIPLSFNSAGPGYMAYIPGGGLFHSALADLVADGVNRYVAVWLAAPRLARIETDVLRWFADWMGYPLTARGILTTGGSLAMLTALVTARRERLPEDFLSGVVYASDQTHHSVLKSALLAGFPRRNIVELPADSNFRFDVERLAERVRSDRAAGLTPFAVVASAGTTNTGAVDDLEALAELAERERLWLHVDAAYGGFIRLTERGRRLLRGIERADSIVLDPHKGLFLPFGTGALLVRDGLALRRAHSVHADYMPPLQEGSGEVPRMDFSEHGPELSRDFRGLRVWLPLKLHGMGPFRANLEEKLALIRLATEELRRMDGIEILAEPQLTVVAFRLVRPGLGEDALNALNRRLLERILAGGRAWLSGALLGRRFAIRICVLSFRTHRDRVEACLDDIRTAIGEVWRE